MFTEKLNRIIKDNKGFTIVELTVVLVIMGILVAIAVPSLTGYIDQAQNKANKTEMESVVKAAESTVEKSFKLGTSIVDLNAEEADLTAYEHVIKKIKSITSANGTVQDYHVSYGTGGAGSQDGAPAGTLTYLRYSGNGWTMDYTWSESGPIYTQV